MQKYLSISTDWAYKSMPNLQKRVCNLYTFWLSFHFAHHRWRLGPDTTRALLQTGTGKKNNIKKEWDSKFPKQSFLFFHPPPQKMPLWEVVIDTSPDFFFLCLSRHLPLLSFFSTFLAANLTAPEKEVVNNARSVSRHFVSFLSFPHIFVSKKICGFFSHC